MGKPPAAAEREADQPQGSSPPGPPVRDVLDTVPFLHRLSTKFLGMIAVVALASLAALWFAERRMQRDLLGQLERSTALLGETIQTTAHDALLEARPSHAYRVMELVGRLEGIERVRVLDKRGAIVFSTEPLDVGEIVAKDSATCAGCHGPAGPPLSRAPVAARSRIVGERGARVLALVSPMHNARACATAGCHVHPPGRQVLGLLELRVSLDRLDAEVLAFRRGFVLVLAGAVVVLAGLLYLFGRAEVVEPVAVLVEGMRRVAKDDLDVEIRVQSRGELGLLAAAFNDMTRSLQRLEGELNGMMAGLEREVEARAAELRAAQEQLLRSEKLSSLGQLSASIAHEINNPLAGILTFAKLVSRTLADGAPDDARRAALQRNLALVERGAQRGAALQRNLALVEREAQRCSAIVRNLLDFARERRIEPLPMDARAAVEEALSLVSHQFQTLGLAIERDLAPVPEVLADFGQLRQAFVNIAMNACEAMGTSGRLRIVTREAGGAAEIAFSDTGPGIPVERLSRIFDPFFTTKEKGTGLGLSVVYGIIQRHGGTIAVDSSAGRGTTFTIRLPAAASAGEPTEERAAAT